MCDILKNIKLVSLSCLLGIWRYFFIAIYAWGHNVQNKVKESPKLVHPVGVDGGAEEEVANLSTLGYH